MQRPNIFHFKAFGIINLHYEIRIFQKIYSRVTMTVYVKCVVRFNLHKMLPILPHCQVPNRQLFDSYLCRIVLVFFAISQLLATVIFVSFSLVRGNLRGLREFSFSQNPNSSRTRSTSNSNLPGFANQVACG